ncbi:MAG: alpha/beta hydrolase [Pseudomonadota bacterium]
MVDLTKDASALAEALNSDAEFMLAARFWDGGFRLSIGDRAPLEIRVTQGAPSAASAGAEGLIAISGPEEIWRGLLETRPERFLNDLGPAMALGLELESAPLVFTQYYPALMRAIEVMRGEDPTQRRAEPSGRPVGAHDAATGRYVHLDLGGDRYRVYYEEAGQGVPLLLQHTAGAHGAQWRHLFERPEITDRFRLIAYDLPYHGKSLPPTGRRWWAEPYQLNGDFLRSVPVALADALGLERPAFMGCSVGGLLALDLALHHPERFRAVISVEGVLRVEDDVDDEILAGFWHPQVSNEFKGRLMHGLTSPTAPEAYRRETIQTYMAGWPPCFLGDLHYYAEEFDLRERAGEIDTSKVAVHILNGEYDWTGSCEKGEAAHRAIRGSTWTRMEGLGHFPMSEDPEAFLRYLTPLLDRIAEAEPVAAE